MHRHGRHDRLVRLGRVVLARHGEGNEAVVLDRDRPFVLAGLFHRVIHQLADVRGVFKRDLRLLVHVQNDHARAQLVVGVRVGGHVVRQIVQHLQNSDDADIAAAGFPVVALPDLRAVIAVVAQIDAELLFALGEDREGMVAEGDGRAVEFVGRQVKVRAHVGLLVFRVVHDVPALAAVVCPGVAGIFLRIDLVQLRLQRLGRAEVLADDQIVALQLALRAGRGHDGDDAVFAGRVIKPGGISVDVDVIPVGAVHDNGPAGLLHLFAAGDLDLALDKPAHHRGDGILVGRDALAVDGLRRVTGLVQEAGRAVARRARDGHGVQIAGHGQAEAPVILEDIIRVAGRDPEGLAELLALPVPPVGGNAPVAAVFAQPETEQHRIRNGARHGFLVHQNDVFLVLPEQPRHCRAGFQAVLEQSAGTQRGIGLRVDREFLVGIRPDEQHAVVDRDLRSLVQIGVRAEQAVVSGIVVHLRRREALEAGVGLRQML